MKGRGGASISNRFETLEVAKIQHLDTFIASATCTLAFFGSDLLQHDGFPTCLGREFHIHQNIYRL